MNKQISEAFNRTHTVKTFQLSHSIQAMNLEEFEVQSQSAIEEILEHLQTTNLLVTQAEEHVEAVGRSVQSLSQLIEEFITQQRSQDNQKN